MRQLPERLNGGDGFSLNSGAYPAWRSVRPVRSLRPCTSKELAVEVALYLPFLTVAEALTAGLATMEANPTLLPSY